MAKTKTLRPLSKRELSLFKIKNRRGYAAICHKNLTEGNSIIQVIARMNKALKREGLVLK